MRSWRLRARPSPPSPRRARWPIARPTRVIDAAGKIVMPGGIDPHVHMQHPFMVPDGTILYTQGPTGSAWPRSTAAPPR